MTGLQAEGFKDRGAKGGLPSRLQMLATDAWPLVAANLLRLEKRPAPERDGPMMRHAGDANYRASTLIPAFFPATVTLIFLRAFFRDAGAMPSPKMTTRTLDEQKTAEVFLKAHRW